MSNTLPWPEKTTAGFDRRLLPQTRVEQRAAIVALSRGGFKAGVICTFIRVSYNTASRWIRRVKNGEALSDLPRCGRPRIFPESARLTAIAVYCQQVPPLPGVHRWSLRDAQHYFKGHPEIIGGAVSRSTIQRILLEHALRPHRNKYYLQITDADFFPKMEQIIACYLEPPEHLYCFDECTCIQALRRLTPKFPAAAGQPSTEDFEYERNGVTDLLAFLNPATGGIYGRCTANHDRHILCEAFRAHIESHPSDTVLHYIMDNLTTHYHDDFCQLIAELSGIKCPPLATGAARRQWLQSTDKRIVIHFVPYHASWLNMVEIWFGILKQKCLKYDHFSSVEHLHESITAFMSTWNESFAHPFKWSYTGKDLYGKAVCRFCRLLAMQTGQMDSKFLASQLLLMCNIADKYVNSISDDDWRQLLDLAPQSKKYIETIIETETGPKRQQKAREAYARFTQIFMADDPCQAKAA